jgi:NADH dehydrogenase (ubiquinone) 1 beta subcomplex subunit 8
LSDDDVYQIHEQDEVLSMWGPDPPPIRPQEALKQLTLAALGFVGVGFLIKEMLVPEMPAVRREYPYGGLVAELGGVPENKVRSVRTGVAEG